MTYYGSAYDPPMPGEDYSTTPGVTPFPDIPGNQVYTEQLQPGYGAFYGHPEWTGQIGIPVKYDIDWDLLWETMWEDRRDIAISLAGGVIAYNALQRPQEYAELVKALLDFGANLVKGIGEVIPG